MPKAGRYTGVAIGLHWATAGLVLVNIPLALTHDWVSHSVGPAMMWWHKSLGLTVLALIPLRLLWRLAHPPPAPPPAMRRWETFAAAVTHWGFYALLIALPLTGWALSSAVPRDTPIPLYGAVWPYFPGVHNLPLAQRHALHGQLQVWHAWLAWAVCALLALHVGAYLKHALVNKDDIPGRMTPWPRRARTAAVS
ncbi:MAG TPA: cytochrome b [Caulobacteraceae bacterium]